MAAPEVQTFDGVGAATRGDLLTFVYGADARVHRTRWAFDVADQFVEKQRDILVLFVIPPESALPDGPTRAENTRRFRSLFPSIRFFVSVPLGDTFRTSVVKAVMRAMIVAQGQSSRHVIASTEDEGIARVLEKAGSLTPAHDEIRGDLQAIRDRLAIEAAAS